MSDNLNKVCANCQYTFYGFAESSMHYGLRCSLKDESVTDNETCKGFELNSYYEAQELKLKLEKAEETLRKIRDLDYRGNREEGSVIAFKYFQEKEKI